MVRDGPRSEVRGGPRTTHWTPWSASDLGPPKNIGGSGRPSGWSEADLGPPTAIVLAKCWPVGGPPRTSDHPLGRRPSPCFSIQNWWSEWVDPPRTSDHPQVSLGPSTTRPLAHRTRKIWIFLFGGSAHTDRQPFAGAIDWYVALGFLATEHHVLWGTRGLPPASAQRFITPFAVLGGTRVEADLGSAA